jgi:hypothetical protein
MPLSSDIASADQPLFTSPWRMRLSIVITGITGYGFYNGYSERLSEEEARTMGIRAFLFKPIVTKVLADTVRGALDEKGSLI